MPEWLSIFCIDGHKIAVVIAQKNQAPGSRQGSSPRLCRSNEWILPTNLPAVEFDSSQELLSFFTWSVGSSGTFEATTLLIPLDRARILRALFHGDYVKQSRDRTIGWREPVGASNN